MQKKEISNHGESEESKLIATIQPNTFVPLPFIPHADLPDEIALAILGYLSLIDLYRAMRVNKTWYRLIQDTRIWQPFINQYTKGHLWSYLLRQPNLAIYQTYFEEVFAEKGITFDNLDEIIQATKEQFAITVRDGQIYIDIRKSFFDYLHEAELSKRFKMTADKVQSLPSQLCTDFLSAESNLARCPRVVENIHQLIPALRFINQLDIFLTEFIFVRKLVFKSLYKFQFDWLLNSKWNRLLTPRTIMALSGFAGNDPLLYTLSEPALNPLLQSFTQKEVMLCASLPTMEADILKNPVFLSKLSAENIGEILRKIPYSEQTFNFLLQNNSVFMQRLDSEFLITLAQKVNRLALPILTHPILLHRLNEEQCIKLMNMLNEGITKLLDSEVFWTFKTNNFSQLLLSYNNFRKVLCHDRAAALIAIADIFNDSLFDFGKGLALAKQPILLNRLTNSQLVELALSHPKVALTLLHQEPIVNRWNFDSLETIVNHFKPLDSNDFSQIIAAADAIRSKILTKNRERSGQLIFSNGKVVSRTNQPISYPPEKGEHPVPQNFKQMRIVRGQYRLEIQPVAPSPAPKRPDPPLANHPVFPQRAHKKPSVTPAQIIVTSLLILLGIAGVALLFSGIGAFMGAGFIVSALLMVNLKMSVATMASLLMIGGLTTGIASAYSLSFLYDDEPLAPKQNLAQPPAPNPPRVNRPKNLRPASQATVKRDSGEPEPVYGSPLRKSIPRKQVDVEIKPAPATLQI